MVETSDFIVLEKGEKADYLYGGGIYYITKEDIKALLDGKRLYTSINDEYAIVIKRKGQWNGIIDKKSK